MADKVRGALNNIDWSKTNEVSININKSKSRPQAQSKSASQPPPSVKKAAPAAPSARPQAEDEIPVNQYRSIVAPVKSGRDDNRPVRKQTTDNGRRATPGERYSNNNEANDEEDEDAHVYLGYLGSIRMPADKLSSGILAIQAPMRELYFPYREQKSIAQERVINVKPSGLEIYYMPDPDADDPETLAIDWKDILYVEPLRFSTKKPSKDRKTVRAAFEPCEAQRLTLLGNRDTLYSPLSKQHKHISLLKHPALLTMVVKSAHNTSEIFTHGYICGTVEESVFLARQVRDKLETIFRESMKSGDRPATVMMGSNLSASQMSISSSGYKLQNHSARSSHSKLKSHKKKKEKGTYTTHEGNEGDDFGSFNFGMAPDEHTDRMRPPQDIYYESSDDEEIQQSIHENFVIGRPGLQGETRQKSRHSIFAEMEEGSYSTSRSTNDSRPVGVVQPQMSSARDGFRVLPTDVKGDKSKLKPTPLNVKSKQYSEYNRRWVTPELDLKLKMRQQEETSAPVLSSLAPRSVVNPLADAGPDRPKSYLSSAPGPISKMSASLAFNPTAALPQSGWHESVIGNYKSKEKIDNRLTSQTVDVKEFPKLESDKKEIEMANLFSNVDMNSSGNPDANDNFGASSSGTIDSLYDAMGFMP